MSTKIPKDVGDLLAKYKEALDEWIYADDVINVEDFEDIDGEEYEASCERARELTTKAYAMHTRMNIEETPVDVEKVAEQIEKEQGADSVFFNPWEGTEDDLPN